MISYLNGKIIVKEDNLVIISVNGVGYELSVSDKVFSSLPGKGKEAEIYCYLDVTDRGASLYGFSTYEKLKFFKLLRGITGIGPKAALKISSSLSLSKIKKAAEEGNESVFTEVPGIGKKKARKIILELAGKLSLSDNKSKVNQKDKEIIAALVNLGFKKTDAKEAVSDIEEDMENREEKIKKALKVLSKK